MKIKDPNDPSKEIEVFTQAEIDQKIKDASTAAATAAANEALENYKKQNPDKTREMDELKNKLAKAEADLSAAVSFDDGSPERRAQIERLRAERDSQAKEFNAKISALESQVTTLVKTQTETLKSQLLDRFAGKDVEARKKVEYEFERYDAANTSPDGMVARMEKAAQIAGVSAPEAPGAMDSMGGHGGSRGQGQARQSVVASENTVTIGSMLGVKKEEIDAHLAAKNGNGGAK